MSYYNFLSLTYWSVVFETRFYLLLLLLSYLAVVALEESCCLSYLAIKHAIPYLYR